MLKIITKSEEFFEKIRIKKIAKENNVNFSNKDLEEQFKNFTQKEATIEEILNDQERTLFEKRDTEIRARKYYRELSININKFYFIEKERRQSLKSIEKNGFKGSLSDFIKVYPYLIGNTDLYVVKKESLINDNTLDLFIDRFAKKYKDEDLKTVIENLLTYSPSAYLDIIKYKNAPELKSLLRKLSSVGERSSNMKELKNNIFYNLLININDYNKKLITKDQLKSRLK